MEGSKRRRLSMSSFKTPRQDKPRLPAPLPSPQADANAAGPSALQHEHETHASSEGFVDMRTIRRRHGGSNVYMSAGPPLPLCPFMPDLLLQAEGDSPAQLLSGKGLTVPSWLDEFINHIANAPHVPTHDAYANKPERQEPPGPCSPAVEAEEHESRPLGERLAPAGRDMQAAYTAGPEVMVASGEESCTRAYANEDLVGSGLISAREGEVSKILLLIYFDALARNRRADATASPLPTIKAHFFSLQNIEHFT
ncbi:MAG: hypothetical protein SGPRY_008173 [Prymnesium sp.]